MHNTNSPTLQSLQNHLVELQIYLRQREEARASHVLAMREIDSIEAKYRRDMEIEEAQIKAEHERKMQEGRMRYEQQEADKVRRHQRELERQKAAQEKELSEKRKSLQEILFNEQIARHHKIEEERYKENCNLASERMTQFKSTYSEVISYFKVALQPLVRDAELPDAILKASAKVKHIEPSIHLVSDFLESLSAIGYDKSLIVDCLGILSVDDFDEVAPKLREWFSKVPASGMYDCLALDEKGLIVPPWALNKAIAYQHPSNGIMVCFGSNNSCVIEPVTHSEAIGLLSELNSRSTCSKNNWRIPNIDELRAVNLDGLSALGLQVPERCWIEHANAVGRQSAFDRLNGHRIVTGSGDKFRPIFVSD